MENKITIMAIALVVGAVLWILGYLVSGTSVLKVKKVKEGESMVLIRGNKKVNILEGNLIFESLKLVDDAIAGRASFYNKNAAIVDGLQWLGLPVDLENGEVRFNDDVKKR